MKKFYLFLICIFTYFASWGQMNDFSLGKVGRSDLLLKNYPLDATAHAFYLDERGEAVIDNSTEFGLTFYYYAKIKILDEKGKNAANITIPFYKSSRGDETVMRLQAASYNMENGKMVKKELNNKAVFREDVSENVSLMKFTFPDIREGTVIEYRYELFSPYIFNFRSWYFQEKMPKVKSEFWAKIPANFNYNIRINGYLKLDKNEQKVTKECFSNSSGGVADCIFYKFMIDSIPAFVDEKYMTVAKNFLSALHFELSEVKHFNGSTDKISKTWENVDQELKIDKGFGKAIEKGKKDFSKLGTVISATNSESELEKAKGIFYKMQKHFNWNGKNRQYCENNLSTIYQNRNGNAADINLSLVAMLQAAGLNAHPVLLSTRNNGYPVEVFPVISDFNYVIAYLKIGKKSYLLDATDKFTSFGMLPFRCLNQKVRVMDFDGSFWMDTPQKKEFRTVSQLDIDLAENGKLSGNYVRYKYGYDALEARNRIANTGSTENYRKDFEEGLNNVLVNSAEYKNLDQAEKPFIEKYELDFVGQSMKMGDKIYLPLLPLNPTKENPFKLNERNYPVDFGAKWEIQHLVNITLPANYKVVDLPKPITLALPDSGGTFVLSTAKMQGKVSIVSKLSLNKPIYSPQEYAYLKALFNKIIQAQGAVMVLEKVN